MELLWLDLVKFISKFAVDPVENIKSFDAGLQQLHVQLSADNNVESEQTLNLHDILMKLLFVKTGQKLHNQVMLFQSSDLALCLRS